MLDSLEIVLEAEKNEKESSELLQQRSIRQHGLEFHENHGRNVQLKSINTTAIRTDSYNQGELLWITQLLPEKPVESNKSISKFFFNISRVFLDFGFKLKVLILVSKK